MPWKQVCSIVVSKIFLVKQMVDTLVMDIPVLINERWVEEVKEEL